MTAAACREHGRWLPHPAAACPDCAAALAAAQARRRKRRRRDVVDSGGAR